MRGNPETALLAREERDERDGRQEMLRSPERRDLNQALEAFARRYGAGDAAAWCCTRATQYTLIANPRSTREERIAAANALFDAEVEA